MAKKNDFTANVQEQKQAIYGAPAADQQPEQPKTKKEYYRFNMRFPMEMKTYLQEIAWQNRTDITGYLTELVRKDMEAHPNWRDSLDILNK